MGLDGRNDVTVMTEARLKAIYASTMARPPAGCPEPEALQALARREGPEERRLATLDHAMSCASCRAELDLLRSIERAGAETGAAARRPARRTWFVPAALAATVLLAVGLGRMALAPGGEEPIRSGGEAGAVAVLAPAAEAPAGAPLTFAWRPVAGAGRYRVEVMTGGGDLAIEAETRDTAVTLEGVARLAAGDYRWWVVAMTPRPGPRSELRPLRLTAR
jgi:hypothetical protein